MKQFVNNYMVLTKPLFRFCMLVLLPLFCAGACICCYLLDTFPLIIVVASIVTFVEIFADRWLFGGIYSKESKLFELMKCSTKGRRLLMDAQRFDMLQRFVICVAAMGGSLWFSGWGMCSIMIEIGVMYDGIQLMLFLTRHWGFGRTQLLFAYFGMLLVGGMNMITLFLTISDVFTRVMLVVVWLLAMGITIGSDRYHSKKIEESFIDDRSWNSGS